MHTINYNIFKSLILLIFSCVIVSCSKDNMKDAPQNISCNYSVEYNNSDSSNQDTLFIEYYSPQIKENLRDTLYNENSWKSSNFNFNSKDSIYLKVVAITSSYNPMVSTTVDLKFALIDDKNITLSYIDHKSISDNSVLIFNGKTIITDTKTLSGIVQFSKK